MVDFVVYVFDGKFYIYFFYDCESGVEENDNGDYFDMCDYYVFFIEDVMNGIVIDYGVVLKVLDVFWVGCQLWDCDVVCKNGNYYMYFLLKDWNDIFCIGVVVSDCFEGLFIFQFDFMCGSYSIDLVVFDDGNGNYYMYFGGLWGGQFQCYCNNKVLEWVVFLVDGELVLFLCVVKFLDDMFQFVEELWFLVILDEYGYLLSVGDNVCCFFEVLWMYKYNGKYYFFYFMGDIYLFCYVIGDNLYGLFIY